MTAVPAPSQSRLAEEEPITLFETSNIKKDLSSAFDTPAVVKKRISRLSQNFQQLPAEYIKVFLRLRPFTEKELKDNEDQKCMKISDDRHILTVMAPKESKMYKASNRGIGESVRHYTFTKIFEASAGQKEFYQETANPLVQQFIDGNNALIFTYGVTNAGKTYTLQGTPGNEGVIPQSIEVLFNQIGDKMLEKVNFVPKMAANLCSIEEGEIQSRGSIKEEVMAMADESRYSFGQKSQTSLESSALTDSIDTSVEGGNIDASRATSKESFGGPDQINGPVKYAVFVSFVEVYRELVYDLLVPVADDKRKSRPVLCIADDKKGTAYVKGMREIQVNSPQEVLKVLSVGQRNLHVAATKLNKDSSRSHCIFTITLVQVMDIPDPHGARVSKISFCDLAGSERANKTGEAGDRLKEAGKINTSLMKLGMCIADLRHNQRYRDDKSKQKAVFFRESKLTRLFRNYLLGDGSACMIVNANMCASGFDETAHVLKFSAIAKEVQIINKPKRSGIVKKSRATLFDEKFDTLIQGSNKPRETIAWEKKLTPVKDEEETAENEEEEESDLEEGSEEESGSDSDDQEQSVECDVSFWKNREKKYLELIDMLKKALLEEKKKSKESEAAIRDQCAQFMHNQIVEIEQRHKDGVEETMDILLNEQQERLEVMANLSNINMKELKEGFEKKIWELTAKNTTIEKELNECREQVNSKTTDLLAAEEKLTSLNVAYNELKMEVEKKENELASLRRRSRASSRFSSGGFDKEEAIQDLMKENEEGKNIIHSLMTELDEYRSQVESTQEDYEKLKEELKDAQQKTESVVEEKVSAKDAEHKAQLEALNKRFEKNVEEITNLENKAQELLKNQGLFAEEIIIFDEERMFKFTEGLLQHLPEFLSKKEEQITQLTTDIEKEIEDKLAIKERLSVVKSDLEKASSELLALKSDLKIFQTETEQMKNSHSQQISDLENDTNVLKENHEKEVEELKNKVKSLEEASAKLLSSEERVRTLEKEAEERKTFEQQLMKETDRLHSEVEKLKKENHEVKQTSLKRSSDFSEKLRDVEILTQDRNDLRARVDTLRKNLTEVTKEKDRLQEELRENIANQTTVQNTTELMELKTAVSEKDAELKKLVSEKDDLCAIKKNLEEKIEENRKQVEDVKNEKEKERSRFLAENEELKTAKSQLEKTVDERSSEVARIESQLNVLRQENSQLKCTIDENKKESEKNQADAEKAAGDHKAEKEALIERQKELESDLTKIRKTLNDLEKEKVANTKLRKDSDKEKSNLEEELDEKQKELQQVQSSFAEFKTKMKEHVEQTKKDYETEVKLAKESHGQEIKHLQAELAQSKKTVDAKEKELDGFRENRDRIVKALEVQISNDRANNKLLKENLDKQMAENVKLKSQNAATLAENSEMKKRLQEKESSSRMRKSVSESVLLEAAPAPQVKLEPISPQQQSGPSPRKRQSKSTPAKEPAKETNQQTGTSEEDAAVEKTRRSSRATKGVKRGSSTGGRGSKRGRRATRPATPLPEVPSAEEEEEISSPPKKSRTSSRSTKRSTNVSLKKEAHEQGVLDDSELLKETGNSRQFPQPTLEIDVTPDLSKKAARARKRVGKKDEQDMESEDAETGTFSRRSTRKKTRANSANTNNNSNSSTKTSDEDPVSAVASATKNLARVGAMIKNSPVGHVLKAISPAGSSPKKSKKAPEEQQKKTRRLVKLHPDDISSPLEATPTPDSVGDFPAVSHTPARKLRSLRSRK